ncbi:hypothetical protein ACIA8C_07875 [Nocardia sp. NPDC051321]|uniref:hypothetical protein n=1 Tax=Nocardia sp. NPDC051321 TaxID=3364323 RepID=UPI0037A5B29B
MATGTVSRGHTRGTVTRIAARLVLILLATAAAFWTTWVRLLHDTWTGSSIGFVFVLPVLAIFSAIGITLRRGPELPIHDRQTDLIVGVIGLGLSACTLGLLTPRYRYLYEMLHLDLLAAWLFVISACVLLFGLRPTTRYWPCWLLLLAAFPPPYRAMRVIIGGGSVSAGATMLLFAAFAAAIAVGRTRIRAWIGAGLAFAVGCAVLVVLRIWFPTARILVYQAIPSVVAVLVVAAVMYVDWRRRRGVSLHPLERELDPLTAPQAWAAAATVALAAILIMIIPIPPDYDRSFPVRPGLVVAQPHTVPPGWDQLSERQYPWAQHYFGQGTSMTRQLLRAEEHNPLWDNQSRRRRLVIDTVRAKDQYAIDRYPEFVLYNLPQPRISPPTRIDLGHGITARLNTVLDDRRLLSWTWLTWNWSGTDGSERISLIAADNHESDAAFPPPQPSMLGIFENFLHQFLRGKAVVLDSESEDVDADAEHKDRDMLLSVARAIVAGTEHT